MLANLVKEAAEVLEALNPGASRPINTAKLLMDPADLAILTGWAKTQGHTITERMHGECLVVCLTVTRSHTAGVPVLRNHEPSKTSRR